MHAPEDPEKCLMEAVAWFAGEPQSGRPACVCPVLATYGASLNDDLADKSRQRLKRYVPRLAGTADPSLVSRRVEMAGGWLLDTAVPAWLRLAGQDRVARALEARPSFAADPDAPYVLEAILRASTRASRRAADDASAVGRSHHGDRWELARRTALLVARDAVGASGVDAAVSAALTPRREPSPSLRLAFLGAKAAQRGAAMVAVRAAAWSAPVQVGAASTVGLRHVAGDETLVAYPTVVSESPQDLAAWQHAVWPALQRTTGSALRSALRLLDDMIAVGAPETR